MGKFFPDLIKLIYGERPLEVRTVKTELAITTKRLTDDLYHIQLPNQSPLLSHIEFQLGGESRMPKRMIQYVGLLLDTLDREQDQFEQEIEFDCMVIYLSREYYRHDPGFFILKGKRGFEMMVWYHVIKLWQMDPEPIFKMASPGLLPFTPLMAGNPETLVLKSCEQITKTPDTLASSETKRELLTILTGLAGLVIKDKQLIPKLISEIRVMSENLVFDFIREEGYAIGIVKGREEGALKEIRQGIIKVLKKRFGELPADLSKSLGTLDNLQQLEDLLVEAAVRPTIDEFLGLLKF